MIPCNNSGCIVVELIDGEVVVSDSKDPGPSITYSLSHWQIRCDAMRNAHNAGISYWLPSGVHDTGSGYTWTRDRVTLRFTVEEWRTFHARVLAGELEGRPT